MLRASSRFISVVCLFVCVCACANICLVIDSPIEISPLICIEMECNQCNRCSVQFVLFLFLSLVAAITLSAEWVPIARLVAPFVSFCIGHTIITLLWLHCAQLLDQHWKTARKRVSGVTPPSLVLINHQYAHCSLAASDNSPMTISHKTVTTSGRSAIFVTCPRHCPRH